MSRTFVVGAAIAGIAILNVIGIAAIASGGSFGAFDEPQVQRDARFAELSADTPEESVSSGGESNSDDETETPGSLGGQGLIGVGSRISPDEDDREVLDLLGTTSVAPEEAESVALGEVPGRIFSRELDEDDGIPVYEIRILSDEGNAHELEVSATDGSVLESEIKASGDAADAARLLEEVEVSRDEAVAVAENRLPAGDIVEITLVREGGYAVYGIMVADGANLYELLVDGRSGELLSG